MRRAWLIVLAGLMGISLGACTKEASTKEASTQQMESPSPSAVEMETTLPESTEVNPLISSSSTSNPSATSPSTSEASTPKVLPAQTKRPDIGTKPSVTQVPSSTETSKTEEKITPQEQELISMLDEINQDCNLGEAGCSLKAVKVAAHLLNWGVGTPLTCDQIKEITASWLQPLDQDARSEFNEKLEFVRDTYNQLLGENAQELLDEAGVSDAAYPWSSEPIETIEAVMQTVLGK